MCVYQSPSSSTQTQEQKYNLSEDLKGSVIFFFSVIQTAL